MKITPAHRIQWHEGMLLGPQHFQQESARVDELIAWQHLVTDPYSWGLRRLEVDQSLLVNGLVRIARLEAVMPDGMAVSWSDQDPQGIDLSLDLQPWAEQLQEGELSIYLTVGRTRSLRQGGGSSRFRSFQAPPVEDEVSDALPIDIPRAVPNLALCAGSLPTSEVLHIKIMTVRKDNEVIVRGPFLAALLDIPRDSLLHQRAMALASQMRTKAAFLARQTSDATSRLEDRLAILEHKARLSSLVLGLPVLEALLRAPTLRPYALYLGLCAQLGPMSTLRPGAVPLLPPVWQHADPYFALATVLDALEDLLTEVSPEWRTRTIGFEEGVYALTLEPEWLGSRLVVGMRGQPERELVNWMTGALIGSKAIWTSLIDRRIQGASRQRIEDAPELGLRSSGGYTLFSVEVDERFIVADQPLIMGNLNETSVTQRTHEIVLFTKG